MAQLKVPATAGWNAGKSLSTKPFRIADIVIDPKISSVFKVTDKMRDEIANKIKAEGYDKSQPIVLWLSPKNKYILIDGHTRLAAAKTAGLEEIPAIVKEFESFDDAILYTFERQLVRRNLTQDEIMMAVELTPDMTTRAKVKELGERLGVSTAHIYQIKKVLKEGTPEVIEQVRDGDKTVKSAYMDITKPDAVQDRPKEKTPNKPRSSKDSLERAVKIIMDVYMSEDVNIHKPMLDKIVEMLVNIQENLPVD